MRGLTFPGSRSVEFLEIPDPTPGGTDVVIEVKASGMCGSDLVAYRAAPGAPRHPKIPHDAAPVIAGHEPCGVVVAIGTQVGPAVRVGDRVMVHHYAGCERCTHCRTGWPQMCDQQSATIYGMTDHGAHAPYMRVPASTVIPLADELSFVSGAAISCGVGTAYGALGRIRPSGRDIVLVVGQGPVGLGATLLASAMGAKVIAVDISDSRLELARGVGAEHVINSAEVDLGEAVAELTGGRGADFALEASGAPSARTAATLSLRPWGEIVLVAGGTPLHVDNTSLITSRQLTIKGSWTFSTAGQIECARFVVDRGLDLDQLFTHQWSLDQAGAAYANFDQQSDGKAAFVF